MADKADQLINIYKITNDINGKVYIGQTINSIKRRFNKHCVKNSGCLKLKNAIKKYGKENFSIELLTICEGKECANCIETFYIAVYDSVEKGYNILKIGGSPLPWAKGKNHSDETKNKISGSLKGHSFNKGQIPWNKGIKTGPHSIETKIKIGLKHKGKILSEETKLKISAARKGLTNE